MASVDLSLSGPITVGTVTSTGFVGPLGNVITGVPGTPTVVTAAQSGALLQYQGSSASSVQFTLPSAPPVGTFFYVYQGLTGGGAMVLKVGPADQIATTASGPSTNLGGGTASATSGGYQIYTVIYCPKNLWVMSAAGAWTAT